MPIAALIGNGVSIAYNPELSVCELDHVSQALPLLAPLGARQYTAAGADIVAALDTTHQFLARLHRTGMGVVLQLIAERAYGVGEDARAATYGELIKGLLTAADEPHHLSVATLNYDGVAHSVLLDLVNNNLADLAHGFATANHEIADGITLQAQRLHDIDDIPADLCAWCRCTARWAGADPPRLWRGVVVPPR